MLHVGFNVDTRAIAVGLAARAHALASVTEQAGLTSIPAGSAVLNVGFQIDTIVLTEIWLLCGAHNIAAGGLANLFGWAGGEAVTTVEVVRRRIDTRTTAADGVLRADALSTLTELARFTTSVACPTVSWVGFEIDTTAVAVFGRFFGAGCNT